MILPLYVFTIAYDLYLLGKYSSVLAIFYMKRGWLHFITYNAFLVEVFPWQTYLIKLVSKLTYVDHIIKLRKEWKQFEKHIDNDSLIRNINLFKQI